MTYSTKNTALMMFKLFHFCFSKIESLFCDEQIADKGAHYINLTDFWLNQNLLCANVGGC